MSALGSSPGGMSDSNATDGSAMASSATSNGSAMSESTMGESGLSSCESPSDRDSSGFTAEAALQRGAGQANSS